MRCMSGRGEMSFSLTPTNDLDPEIMNLYIKAVDDAYEFTLMLP
jgi:hypothetical protein